MAAANIRRQQQRPNARHQVGHNLCALLEHVHGEEHVDQPARSSTAAGAAAAAIRTRLPQLQAQAGQSESTGLPLAFQLDTNNEYSPFKLSVTLWHSAAVRVAARAGHICSAACDHLLQAFRSPRPESSECAVRAHARHC